MGPPRQQLPRLQQQPGGTAHVRVQVMVQDRRDPAGTQQVAVVRVQVVCDKDDRRPTQLGERRSVARFPPPAEYTASIARLPAKAALTASSIATSRPPVSVTAQTPRAGASAASSDRKPRSRSSSPRNDEWLMVSNTSPRDPAQCATR